MHEPPNDSNEFQNGCGEQNSNDIRTVKSLDINDDDLDSSNCNQKHGEIEECKEALALFCDWVFGMSAHDIKGKIIITWLKSIKEILKSVFHQVNNGENNDPNNINKVPIQSTAFNI